MSNDTVRAFEGTIAEPYNCYLVRRFFAPHAEVLADPMKALQVGY
jgi:hypothetical protein